MNPWNLPPLAEQALDAIIEFGGQKEAARQLGISIKAIEMRMEKAREKMQAPGRVKYLILWDRYRRDNA